MSEKNSEKTKVKKNGITVGSKNAWDGLKNRLEVDEFCKCYKEFLNKCKTERECVNEIVNIARSNNFKELPDVLNSVVSSDWDTRYYRVFKKKVVALAVLGEKTDIKEGYRFLVSHIDSPRLDLKPNPIYEDEEFCLMRSHYYGGIRKYQWVSIPLALHGVIYTKKDPKTPIRVNIGEKPDDPVFVIPDLLPHLASGHRERKLPNAFDANNLNVVIGSVPIKEEKIRYSVKQATMKILNDTLGIEEDDFLFGELKFVPAGNARDIGLDRGLIGSYGQDDRVCAFTSLQAILMKEKPKYTTVCLFFDKEEIGSEGTSSIKTSFLKDFVADLLAVEFKKVVDERYVRKFLMASKCVSADVTAGINPLFKEVHEKQNASKIGHGVGISKYTGSRGKYSTSDASAEYLSELRGIFDSHGVKYQFGLLGKIDLGGGGTLAKFLACEGMDVIDIGVPLLSMHAPFELSSKIDVWYCFKAFVAFILGKKQIVEEEEIESKKE